MSKGAIISGIILILLSLWFGHFLISAGDAPGFVFIYPLVGIGLGIGLIILNKEESKIEKRKDLNSKKTK